MTAKRLSAISLAVFLFLLAGAAALRAGENFVFRGRIVDTANEPVSGAEVYVFDSANVKRPADFISNRTGNDGYYRVELPAGHYRTMAIKRISAAKFGPLGKDDKHSGDPFEIDSAGTKEVIKDFTVMDLREAARAAQKRSDSVVRISGRVVDDSGRPLGMAYGMADPLRKFSGMPHYFSIWTEEDGSYVLFLPKGKLFIGAARDFPPERAYIDLQEVEFTEDTEGVDLIVRGD